MSEHTPGAWSIGITEDISMDDETSEWRAAILEDGSEVAAAYDPSETEVVRRARLIAAAPDLLEALEAAVNGLEWYHATYGKNEADEEFLTQARAAIAKARGEAPKETSKQAAYTCPGCGRPTNIIFNRANCPACLGEA